MTTNDASKICEVDTDACKRQARALCFHCSKNLCRTHLSQHAQLIEESTRTELNLLADRFNELSSRLNDITISSNILEQPFVELEKWRLDSHKKVDQMADAKRREINDKIDEYRRLFSSKNDEQLEKINTAKKMITELVQDADASNQQIVDLRTSIKATENHLNSLNAHKISLVSHEPICFVDIHTQFFRTQSLPTYKGREFKIIYVRLNGMIRNYYVIANENGNMADLIKSFILRYTVVEQITECEMNPIYTIDHLPQSDLILPVSVDNHCIRLQHSEKTILNSILKNDMIVFYEMPHSLNQENNPHILMPCSFQRGSSKQMFGLPIYLSVPRKGCRGQDVRDALHAMLSNFYRSNRSAGQPPYDAYINSVAVVEYKTTKIKLDDVLQDEIDFKEVNASLIVALDNQLIDTNEWSYFGQVCF